MKHILAVMLLFPAMAAAACLAPSGPRIVVGDLAAAVPALEQAPADTFVAFAPQPGSVNVVGPMEWNRLMATLHLEAAAPRGLCFAWPMQSLTPRQITDAIRASLEAAGEAAGESTAQDSAADIELVDWLRGPVPAGRVSFPASQFPRARGGGVDQTSKPVLWRGRIDYGREREFVIWARVAVTVPGQRWVAVERLQAGQPVLPGQVREEPSREPPFSQPFTWESLAGKVPRKDVAAGTMLTPELLEAPLDVARGETVALEVRTGRMRIRMEVVAETAGRRGDRIPVHDRATGRRMYVVVEAPGRVSLIETGAKPEAAKAGL